MTTALESDGILKMLCKAWTSETDISQVRAIGKDYYRVILPNYSIDGSRHEFFIRQDKDNLTIRDFGLNIMNLEANNININSDTIRQKIIKIFELYAKDSSFDSREIVLNTTTDKAEKAILDFTTLLTIIGSFALDADFTPKFTFEDEVDMILKATYGGDNIIRNWYDPSRDPRGTYKTDYLIMRDTEDRRPAAAFAISASNSAKVAKAALAFTHLDESVLKMMVFRDFGKMPAADRQRARDHADVIIENIVGDSELSDRIELLHKFPRQ